MTDEERAALTAGLRSRDAFVLRRCQILLASASGKRASQIAAELGCDTDTALNAINAFNQAGLEALTAGSSVAHTIYRGFDAAQAEQLQGAAAPESAQLRQRDQRVDAGVGRRGQLRARLDAGTGEPRSGADRLAAAGCALEAGQAVDHQP